MKRWSIKGGEFGGYIENEKVDKFLQEIADVCRKHGYSISHEDGHGAFEIEDFSESNVEWLMAAADNTTDSKPTS